MTVYKNDLADQLKASIDSIVNQKGAECQLLIGVDGYIGEELSTVLVEYNENSNVSVRYFDENRGLAATLNDLITEVHQKFDYLARMDADDVSIQSRIIEQVTYLQKHQNIDVLGTGCIEFNDVNGMGNPDNIIKILPKDHELLRKAVFTRSPFVHPSVMFRSSVFIDRDVRYPENLHLSEDLGLWCLMLAKGYKFANIEKPLIYFRLNTNTIERRRGFKKAFSELKSRFSILTYRNAYLFSGAILVFLTRLLPKTILKVIYKFR
jgi:hypothetical protein